MYLKKGGVFVFFKKKKKNSFLAFFLLNSWLGAGWVHFVGSSKFFWARGEGNSRHQCWAVLRTRDRFGKIYPVVLSLGVFTCLSELSQNSQNGFWYMTAVLQKYIWKCQRTSQGIGGSLDVPSWKPPIF
jgi:hypothetical protein